MNKKSRKVTDRISLEGLLVENGITKLYKLIFIRKMEVLSSIHSIILDKEG